MKTKLEDLLILAFSTSVVGTIVVIALALGLQIYLDGGL